jgi:hypothetical protein
MSKEIILKAAKDAPEFIAQGHCSVTLEDGCYRTESRAFADSIIGNGYATEVENEVEKTTTSRTTLNPVKEKINNV